jgi:hypothetical protein
MMGNNKLEIRKVGNTKWVGWTTRVGRRRTNYVITIDKMIVLGTGIRQGKILFSYLDEDKDGRPLMSVYLDGKPRKFGD